MNRIYFLENKFQPMPSTPKQNLFSKMNTVFDKMRQTWVALDCTGVTNKVAHDRVIRPYAASCLKARRHEDH